MNYSDLFTEYGYINPIGHIKKKSHIKEPTFDDLIEEPIEIIEETTEKPTFDDLIEEPIEKPVKGSEEPTTDKIEKSIEKLTKPVVKQSYNEDLLKIDIEDLLKSEGITSINGKKIKFGNKALRSANASFGSKYSNHKRRDPHTGNAMARDISIIGGTVKDYADFRSKLLSNPRIVLWFDTKGWGIINEITPAILSRTKGTGPHFHFGPDTWAKRTWKTWVSNPNIPITSMI